MESNKMLYIWLEPDHNLPEPIFDCYKCSGGAIKTSFNTLKCIDCGFEEEPDFDLGGITYDY